MAGSCFIDTTQLATHLSQGDVHILDGTLVASEDPKATFQKKRIPGARFFDQMEVRNKEDPHPLAYPTVEAFRTHMMNLRVPNDGSLVVVYDQAGLYTAPRVWFMLKYFGYENVLFLNGGLPKWEAEKRPLVGGPTDTLTTPVQLSDYQFTPRPEMTVVFEQMREAVKRWNAGAGNEVLWDPRNPAVTSGTLIPHSLNFFFEVALNSDKTIKPQTEIRAALRRNGLDVSKPVIVTCNRGMNACAGYLLLTHIGKRDVTLYPGSFTEPRIKTAIQYPSRLLVVNLVFLGLNCRIPMKAGFDISPHGVEINMSWTTFIDCQEVADVLTRGETVYIVDGSMLAGKDTRAAYLEKRIPSARFFDQQEIRNKELPHPLAYPSLDAFRQYMMTLKVPNDGSLVVVYDQFGMVAGPRVWFLLRYFGYSHVAFLNGGLPKWESEGRLTVSGPVEDFEGPSDPQLYQVTPHDEMLIGFEGMKALVQRLSEGNTAELLWDPRNQTAQATIDSLIPHVANVFYQRLLNPDLTVKSKNELCRELADLGIDVEKSIITTCNRGVISCTGILLLKHIGKEAVMYAGSWMEWSRLIAASA